MSIDNECVSFTKQNFSFVFLQNEKQLKQIFLFCFRYNYESTELFKNTLITVIGIAIWTIRYLLLMVDSKKWFVLKFLKWHTRD